MPVDALGLRRIPGRPACSWPVTFCGGIEGAGRGRDFGRLDQLVYPICAEIGVSDRRLGAGRSIDVLGVHSTDLCILLHGVPVLTSDGLHRHRTKPAQAIMDPCSCGWPARLRQRHPTSRRMAP